MRTTTLCKGLLASGLCLLIGSLQAADFDGSSLLYARLGMSSQATNNLSPMFLRISANGTRPAEDVEVPLGSVWKLFIYAYAVDRAIATPDYVCHGGDVAKAELYCCDPDQSISRDEALAKSCGLFFDAERLHLDALDWRRYWSSKSPQVAWLADLSQMKPASHVSVSSLLHALASIDGVARERAEAALLGVVLTGRGHGALPYLGGRYRVKTFTWNHPQRSDSVIGGAAGWTSDGSAVWFGALGSSVKVLQDYAPQLAAATEGAGHMEQQARCIDVALFARYPIKRISTLPDGVILAAGDARDLHGRYRVEFSNGKQLVVQANNEIRLDWNASQPVLSARLDENEYVARVIDREGRATEKEAARALSIVARTYLLQNAVQHGECLAIADSSRTQRVSPNPATAAALDIAAFTSGLILQGANAQYRLNATGKNVLSWQSAVAGATSGMRFDEILRRSFEHGTLAAIKGATVCKQLPDAERWLQAQARHWRYALQSEPGFVAPQPQVCLLSTGNPYSDLSRQRIYVRGLNSLNSRITLAHEYLHLAFSSYPSGQDENYIEQWARRLIERESRS